MAHWIDTTVRTIILVIVSGFVVVGCLFLLLLSVCAGQSYGGGSHPEQGLPFALAAIVLLAGGIAFIVWLSRNFLRSEEAMVAAGPVPVETHAETILPPPPQAQLTLPLHLSARGQHAVRRLVEVLTAQVILSGVFWFVNQVFFWSTPRAFHPHNWMLALITTYVLHQLPYIVLIFLFLKRPSRLAFIAAIAVPSVLLLQSLFGLSLIATYYIHHPVGSLLLVIPWSLHIAILIVAYQAIKQVGLHPQPSSIVIISVIAFFYFLSIQSVTAYLYRVSLY